MIRLPLFHLFDRETRKQNKQKGTTGKTYRISISRPESLNKKT